MRYLLIVCFALCVLSGHAQTLSGVSIEGNHKTDSTFIVRFFEFHVGDSINQSFQKKLKSTKEALINTGLFNQVDYTVDTLKNGSGHVVISVQERWYLWAYPQARVYETNFNTWLTSPNLRRLAYGFDLVKYNLGGKGKTLRLLGRLGYVKSAGIELDMPFLMHTNHGLNVNLSFNQRNELVYGTENNKRLFYKLNNVPVIYENVSAKLQYSFRQNNIRSISISTQYQNHQLDDSLSQLNAVLPENRKKGDVFTLGVQFRLDNRNFKPYPLLGYFVDAQLYADHFSKSHVFLTFIGDARKYFQISNRWYAGAGIRTKIGFIEQIPYLLSEGLGYRHNVRGFESYVIDGRHNALFKSNIKFKVFDQTYTVDKINDPRFNYLPMKCMLTAFADAGYVWSNQNNFSNSLTETLLSGFGLGVDFVTYYDRILRVELSHNSLNETGVFIHFTQPI